MVLQLAPDFVPDFVPNLEPDLAQDSILGSPQHIDSYCIPQLPPRWASPAILFIQGSHPPLGLRFGPIFGPGFGSESGCGLAPKPESRLSGTIHVSKHDQAVWAVFGILRSFVYPCRTLCKHLIHVPSALRIASRFDRVLGSILDSILGTELGPMPVRPLEAMRVPRQNDSTPALVFGPVLVDSRS